MTELVTAREIPSERPLAWRLAHDARVRYVLLVGALAGAYYGAAQIGYELKFTGAVAAIVWLPVGVGIAFLYLGGLSLWPGVVLGDLLANQYETLPVGSAIGQTIGNTLEVRRRRVSDPAARAERSPAGQRGRSLRPARRDLRGHRGQRDDRAPLACASATCCRRRTCRTSGTPGGSATQPARSSSFRSRWPGGGLSTCPGRGRGSLKAL